MAGYDPLPIDRISDAAHAIDGLMGLVADRRDLHTVPADGLYFLLAMIQRDLRSGLDALEREAMAAARRA